MDKRGLRDLREEIKKMDENEKETEKQNEIVNVVKMILELTIKIKKEKG